MYQRCQKCGSTATVFEPGGQRCLTCKHTWLARIEYPEPPMPVSAGPVHDTRRRWFLFALVVGLVFASGAVWMMYDAGENPQRYPDPAVTHPEFFKAEPPKAEILSAELGQLATGQSYSAWWLIEYRNTGTGTISFPKVIARYTDTNGAAQVLEEGSNVYSLPSGETAWFLLAPLDAAGVTPKFEISPPLPMTEWSAVTRRLQTEEVTNLPDPKVPAYTALRGRIRNTTAETMDSVVLHAIGFDALSQPCAYAMDFLDDDMPPGGTASFDFSADTWQKSAARRWEIHVWGSVKK
jgi:hypothetical protein